MPPTPTPSAPHISPPVQHAPKPQAPAPLNPAHWNFKKPTHITLVKEHTKVIPAQTLLIPKAIDPSTVVFLDNGAVIVALIQNQQVPVMGGTSSTPYIDGANKTQKQAALLTALGMVVSAGVVTSVNGVAQ